METSPTQAAPFRRWDSLTVRVAGVVNLAALIVLGAFWWIDFQRTRSTLLDVEVHKLTEEAKVLAVAQRHFPEPPEFQRFVDRFCEQMDATASPGHHIAVFDRTGTVAARAHVRGDPRLESAMRADRGARTARFTLGRDDFLAVNVSGVNDTRIVVSQSLAPVRAVIATQAVSRAWSIGVLALAILVVSTASVMVWVDRPLGRLVRALGEVGAGDFSARVDPAGSSEVRFLATGLNEMASSLQRVDRNRRVQMRRAREIQRRLLPQNSHRVGDYEIDTAFEPAESVGGDFFDIVGLPDGSAILVILDVCGHGVPAALHTALLRTVLRYESAASADPGALATGMNREFLNITDAGEFATCFLLRLSPEGRIQFASAGHDPALLLRGDGSMLELESGGPVLGVVEGQVYGTGAAELQPGDELLLFTDGVYEVLQPDGTMLGHQRFIALARRHAAAGLDTPQELVAHVRSLARTHGFDDDVTVIRIRRTTDSE